MPSRLFGAGDPEKPKIGLSHLRIFLVASSPWVNRGRAMKVQYFGDVNDYCKFALLRLLAKAGGFNIGVCWMLTVMMVNSAPSRRREDPFNLRTAISTASIDAGARPFRPALFEHVKKALPVETYGTERTRRAAKTRPASRRVTDAPSYPFFHALAHGTAVAALQAYIGD